MNCWSVPLTPRVVSTDGFTTATTSLTMMRPAEALWVPAVAVTVVEYVPAGVLTPPAKLIEFEVESNCAVIPVGRPDTDTLTVPVAFVTVRGTSTFILPSCCKSILETARVKVIAGGGGGVELPLPPQPEITTRNAKATVPMIERNGLIERGMESPQHETTGP